MTGLFFFTIYHYISFSSCTCTCMYAVGLRELAGSDRLAFKSTDKYQILFFSLVYSIFRLFGWRLFSAFVFLSCELQCNAIFFLLRVRMHTWECTSLRRIVVVTIPSYPAVFFGLNCMRYTLVK